MKKLCCFGLLCVLLTGCGGNKLDDNYDEAVLEGKATQVVQYMNDEKYEDITAMGNAEMNVPSLTQKIADAWGPAKTKLGAFKEFDSFTYAGQDGKAVVIVIANYEQDKVQFTISFDSEMKLAGLFFK